MNLMKSFNKNYAIQNIKKSKGILSLLFIAVPVITLFVMYFYDKADYSEPFEMAPLFIVNYLGMYVISFIVSAILMGFSYKKTSVDFVGSMPINRKTMFVTNLIAGIVYLVALQFFTLCVTSLYIVLIPSSLFSISMALDAFYMMTFSYIFVYSICMLASSVSGNVMTQIVVTLLIIFLVPFTRIAIFGDTNVGAFEDIEVISKGVLEYTPISMTYSLPISTAIYGFLSTTAPFGFELVIRSTIYSMVLVIIYSVMGVKMFEKRKMENAGTSFQNNMVHIIVKGLTMYPVIVALVYIGMEESMAILAFAVLMLAIYYLIYDLVTSKKMSIKLKIGSFVITIIVLYTVTYGLIKGVDLGNREKITKTITADGISKISFVLPGDYDNSCEYIDIKKDDIKEFIINNLISQNNDDYYYTAKSSYSYDSAGEQNIRVKMIMTIGGKNYSCRVTISKKDIIKAIEMIRNDEETIEAMANSLATKGKIYAKVQGYYSGEGRVYVSDDMREYLNDNKLKYIDKLLERTEDIIANNKHWGNGTRVIFNKYYNHKNHSYTIICMPEFIDFEEKVAEEVNREAVIEFSKIKKRRGKVLSSYDIYRKKDGILYSSDEATGMMHNDIIDMNFIIQEVSKDVDLSKDYFRFAAYGDGKTYIVYASDTESVIKYLKTHGVNVDKFSSVYTSEIDYDPTTDTYVYIGDEDVEVPLQVKDYVEY